MESESIDQLPELNSLEIFKGSIALENKSSVARDHMANERTFLAWLRTSLSFITIGIGITQLFKLNANTTVKVNESILLLKPFGSNTLDPLHNATPIDDHHVFGKILGSIFIIIGIITLIFGFIRFFKVQYLLTFGYYPATRKSLIVLIFSILVVLLSTLVLVVKNY